LLRRSIQIRCPQIDALVFNDGANSKLIHTFRHNVLSPASRQQIDQNTGVKDGDRAGGQGFDFTFRQEVRQDLVPDSYRCHLPQH
jgi:hypothetical protein